MTNVMVIVMRLCHFVLNFSNGFIFSAQPIQQKQKQTSINAALNHLNELSIVFGLKLAQQHNLDDIFDISMVIIHTLMMKIPIILLALLAIAASQSPPVWAVRFQHEFVESYSSTFVHDIGKIWYEADKNRQRVDHNNGKYDPVCGAIQTASTPCVQLVRDSKRWIFFPLIGGHCCFCCDEAHGCGILRQDWLRNSKYMGKEDINGQTFNKFVDEENRIDYWASTDSRQIARRMVENGEIIKDFMPNTYNEGPILEGVFNLPTYCKESNLCPGPCAKFR